MNDNVTPSVAEQIADYLATNVGVPGETLFAAVDERWPGATDEEVDKAIDLAEDRLNRQAEALQSEADHLRQRQAHAAITAAAKSGMQ